MSVTFYAQNAPDRLEVNLSSANAARIADTLGFDMEEWDGCGQASALDFLGRVLMALAITPRDEGMPSHELPRQPGQCRWIEGGREAGYTEKRLLWLADLARWAYDNGQEVLWA